MVRGVAGSASNSHGGVPWLFACRRAGTEGDFRGRAHGKAPEPAAATAPLALAARHLAQRRSGLEIEPRREEQTEVEPRCALSCCSRRLCSVAAAGWFAGRLSAWRLQWCHSVHSVCWRNLLTWRASRAPSRVTGWMGRPLVRQKLVCKLRVRGHHDQKRTLCVAGSGVLNLVLSAVVSG
eukprot:2886609-Rhodomonas_salina.1